MSFIRKIINFNNKNINQSIRNIYQSSILFESNLSILRKKTGYAFQLCRKALEQNDQNVIKAEKWLRIEAAKQGWEKAEKVKSRKTGQGLIGIHTNLDRTKASIVEVKCETDFVSRNENFIKLVSELSKKLLTFDDKNINEKSSSTDNKIVEKLWITNDEQLKLISENLIIDMIQKLGENIKFIRGCIMKISDNQNNVNSIQLLPYAHAVAGKIQSNDPNIVLGKYGTIIAIEQQQSNNVNNDKNDNVNEDEIDTTQISKTIDEIGSRLGQHIIGLSPKAVLMKEDDTDNNKNENNKIEDKIGDEESESLLKQKFIFNEDITVEQYLKNSNAQVLDFIRIECGGGED